MGRSHTVDRLNDILNAAERWKINCLLGDRSVFTEHALWTAENIDLLDKYFVQNPIEGKDTFVSKLRVQLGPALPEVKRQAAEMVWASLAGKIDAKKS
jgi:5-methylcytosine-specific restriction enzyme B